MRIDLHAHSSASDGSQPPADVVRRAAAAGLDVVALTDHDTVAGWDEAVAALPRGLTLVTGAEISASAADAATGRRLSLHVLAYLFDPAHAGLAAELAASRDARETRARRIVERLAELGAPVSWPDVAAIAGDAPVGRPHIARALAGAGVVPDPAAAFTADWIGSGGRAWVGKRAIDPVRVVELVAAAGGVTVLAHPGAYRRGPVVADSVVADLAAAGLAGVEVDHPDHDDGTRRRLRGLAGELGLLVTGASDDHGALTGHRLGAETTDLAAYEALIAAATRRPVAA